MPIDIESLSGPEEEPGEGVGTGNEGDDHRQSEDSGALLESCRKHWDLCEFSLPEHKGKEEKEADEKRPENVGAVLGMLS